MIRRKLVFGLVLVLGGVACEKKSESKEEAQEEQAASEDETSTDNKDSTAADTAATDAPAVDPAFLVGKWQSDCVNQPGFLQASIYLQYEFAADGTASSKTISYAGADCTRRFTKPDVDAIIAQVNADRASVNSPALNATELAAYNNLWFPQPSSFIFKLVKTLGNGSVEMNAILKDGDQSVNSYLTIYVKDDNLYFAALCSKQDLDSGICDKIVGDTVNNRARDMTKALPFHKL